MLIQEKQQLQQKIKSLEDKQKEVEDKHKGLTDGLHEQIGKMQKMLEKSNKVGTQLEKMLSCGKLIKWRGVSDRVLNALE